MSWYYTKDGQQTGPVSQEEFDGLVSRGEIGAKTLVWQESMPEWKKYGELAAVSHLSDEASPKSTNEKSYPFQFKGSGSEYFGIWIVNLLLSIVTLGLYIPWARVRTRRYFYQNTMLDGHYFEYLADPKKLLVGYLIIFVGLVIYLSSEFINPMLPALIMLVYLPVFPFLMYKSMRFFAANSAYRNVRFQFRGTLGEAYRCYLFMPILTGFTLGLIMPLVIKMQKEYFFGNMAYGQKRSQFHGAASYFFKVLYGAFGIFIGLILLGGVILAISSGIFAGAAETGEQANEEAFASMAGVIGGIFVLCIYLFMFVIFIGADVFIKNYCWNQTVIGVGKGEQFAFENKLRLWPYVGIIISNVILTICTLGIFAPWAKVRLYRYRLQCLSVNGMESLENVVAQEVENDGAVGDSAHEVLDFEFGL